MNARTNNRGMSELEGRTERFPVTIDGPVWFVAAEAVPFAKVGGLGDVAGTLPRLLQKKKFDMRLCLPQHGCVIPPPESSCVRLQNLPEWVGEAKVHLWMDDGLPMQCYEIPKWFGRCEVYGYSDDSERFAAFCLAVAAHIDMPGVDRPAMLHLNDWHTGPLSMLMASNADSAGKQIRTLLTIHSMEYQGKNRPGFLDLFGLGHDEALQRGALQAGGFNAMKAGLSWANAINTVSPTHAKELLTAHGGFGLHEELAIRVRKLPKGAYRGILNRPDDSWNPATDPAVPHAFSADKLSGRKRNRTALLAEMKLSPDAGPVAAFVGRLTTTKGVGLMLETLPSLLEEGFQMVVLGTGNPEWEAACLALEQAWPARFSFQCRFDEAMARRILSGADMLLMPSEREACGLVQQMAMRYGCVPVVHRTGGLADTVSDGVDGFCFHTWSRTAFLRAIRRALTAYRDQAGWQSLSRRAMRTGMDCMANAGGYADMYGVMAGAVASVSQRRASEQE